MLPAFLNQQWPQHNPSMFYLEFIIDGEDSKANYTAETWEEAIEKCQVDYPNCKLKSVKRCSRYNRTFFIPYLFHEYVEKMPIEHDRDACYAALNLVDELDKYSLRSYTERQLHGWAEAYETSVRAILYHLCCAEEFVYDVNEEFNPMYFDANGNLLPKEECRRIYLSKYAYPRNAEPMITENDVY